MAGSEEGEETVTKGNEWEVVSLTASAYAAAPGPKEGDSGHDIHGKDEQNDGETSSAMFMSGHFGFPPSVDENLPLQPVDSEIRDAKEGEYDDTRLISGEGVSGLKDEQNVNIEGLIPDQFSPRVPNFDENDIMLSVVNVKEQSIYSTAAFDSIYSEATLVNSGTTGKGEGPDGTVDYIDHAMDSIVEKSTKGDGDAEFPSEAWWKRRAVSLYTHAKEANTFWSICFAAAVMGIVIIGHRWQQDRWQILRKWQYNIKDEKMGLLRGQIYRLKDVIIGGNRRVTLMRGNIST